MSVSVTLIGKVPILVAFGAIVNDGEVNFIKLKAEPRFT